VKNFYVFFSPITRQNEREKKHINSLRINVLFFSTLFVDLFCIDVAVEFIMVGFDIERPFLDVYSQ